MAGYDNQYSAATNAMFLKRVEMAAIKAAVAIANGVEPQSKVELARKVANDPQGWAVKFAKAVVGQGGLPTKCDADPTGATITDGELDTQVAAVFATFAY